MGGPQESPEKTMGSSPEVVKWARGVLGDKEPGGRLAEVELQEGVFVRVVRGTDVSTLSKTDRRDLVTITDESAWINQLVSERLPEAQGAHFGFAETHPGVRGIKRDEDHGNSRVTAVPQVKAEIDDKTLKASLTPEEIARIYHERTVIALTFGGTELATMDNVVLPSERVAEIIRGVLAGLGVDEVLLNEKRLTNKVSEERDNVELARLILAGKKVDGITPVLWRQEVDAVDQHRAITTRRPRRKNLITPRRKSRTESAS